MPAGSRRYFRANVIGREAEREQRRTIAQLDGTRVDVTNESLSHAMNVAAECAPQVAGEKSGRQRDFEFACGRKPAVGGGREAVENPEVLVENRERLKTDGARDFGEPGAGGEEFLFRGVETGTEQLVGRRRVIVEAEEFEEPGRAEAGAPHDGAGVGKILRRGAHLSDEGLNGFEHRI